MKHNGIVSPIGPVFTGRVLNHLVNCGLRAVLSVALGALVMQCLSVARADDALPVKEPGPQITPAPEPAYTPQGRQMLRYQAFARQTELPAITVTNNTTLEVTSTIRADLSRLAQLSPQEKERLAAQFGVPPAVIGKVLGRATTNAPPDATQIAQDLRTAVVDYGFLQGEWTKYHPPAEVQKVKDDALQALQDGNISQAWELYDGLQRPEAPSIRRPPPPTNLRVVAQ